MEVIKVVRLLVALNDGGITGGITSFWTANRQGEVVFLLQVRFEYLASQLRKERRGSMRVVCICSEWIDLLRASTN